MQISRSILVVAMMTIFVGAAKSAESPNPPVVTRLTKTYYPKFFLRYSPDGSHIAYCRHHRNRRGANRVLVGLRVMRADGSNERALLAEFDSQVQIQEHPCWSPDGKRLVISGGGNDTGNSTKDTFVCDIDDKHHAKNLRKLVPGQGLMLGEEPCYSPSGKRIAFVTIDESLWVVDADGTNKARVVQVDGQYCHQPAWSPDGEWIAFATDRDGSVELYKIRWDGTDLTRLTNRPGIDCRPRRSRDGAWILFTSNRKGNHDLYLMRPDGSDVRALTSHPALDDQADWSPDGKSIAFVSMRDGGFDIYRLPIPADIKIGPAAKPATLATAAAAADGLVAHYDFDEPNDDKRIRDRAGRNYLQLFGARIVSEQERSSLSFNGKSDYALAGNGAQLRIGGPLTISLWVRPAKLKGNGYLISKHGWNIYVGSDGIPRFETRSAKNNAWDTLAASTPLKPEQWTFITAVFDKKAGRLRMYIDGKLSAERERKDGAIGAVAAYSLQLGHYTVSKTQKFHGRLDEIRIYRKSLAAAQVAEEYQRQLEKVVGRATP